MVKKFCECDVIYVEKAPGLTEMINRLDVGGPDYVYQSAKLFQMVAKPLSSVNRDHTTELVYLCSIMIVHGI